MLQWLNGYGSHTILRFIYFPLCIVECIYIWQTTLRTAKLTTRTTLTHILWVKADGWLSHTQHKWEVARTALGGAGFFELRCLYWMYTNWSTESIRCKSNKTQNVYNFFISWRHEWESRRTPESIIINTGVMFKEA